MSVHFQFVLKEHAWSVLFVMKRHQVMVAALQRCTAQLQLNSGWNLHWNERDIIVLGYSRYSLMICVYFLSNLPLFSLLLCFIVHITSFLFPVHVIRSRHYWNLIGLSLGKYLFCSACLGGWQFNKLSFPH